MTAWRTSCFVVFAPESTTAVAAVAVAAAARTYCTEFDAAVPGGRRAGGRRRLRPRRSRSPPVAVIVEV